MTLWMPSDETIAQLAHVGWGGWIVTSFAFFGHVWWGAGALTVYAAIKEFGFDTFVEGQNQSDNAKDFAFYLVGGAAGMILNFVHGVI